MHSTQEALAAEATLPDIQETDRVGVLLAVSHRGSLTAESLGLTPARWP